MHRIASHASHRIARLGSAVEVTVGTDGVDGAGAPDCPGSLVRAGKLRTGRAGVCAWRATCTGEGAVHVNV